MNNEPDLTVLIEAMEKLKEDTLKRQEAKRWKPIESTLSLKEALNRLTKDDLDAIRKQLEIKRASSLKKAELILVLEEKIPALLIETIKMQDQERFRLLMKLVNQGGYCSDTFLEEHQLDYFARSGVVFSGRLEGKKVHVMPQEIMTALSAFHNDSELKAIIARNTEWIKLTQGMLYYYGVLTLGQMEEMIESYLRKPLRLLDYLKVMYHAQSYYQEFRIGDKHWSYYRVFDPNKVLLEVEQRKDLAYYPFSKEQLIKAGVPDFIERNAVFNHFVHFLLKNYQMTRKEAEEIAAECAMAAKMGERPQDILQYLTSRVEFSNLEAISAIMEVLIELINNTREWFLKGHSPAELFVEEKKLLRSIPSNGNIIHFPSNQKIGRNDPCPCGSGKKYKKCCGK
ncbi:YecA family protein [Bacillus tuaregi]|uniref:YecA family protein n=1 Tax=Bacillus tuaregi TaxID=1816695 RepID=UPI000A0558FC|nr:SEC-C metal-binding domain-containing protein [Bacillus tuaregi]